MKNSYSSPRVQNTKIYIPYSGQKIKTNTIELVHQKPSEYTFDLKLYKNSLEFRNGFQNPLNIDNTTVNNNKNVNLHKDIPKNIFESK